MCPAGGDRQPVSFAPRIYLPRLPRGGFSLTGVRRVAMNMDLFVFLVVVLPPVLIVGLKWWQRRNTR